MADKRWHNKFVTTCKVTEIRSDICTALSVTSSWLTVSRFHVFTLLLIAAIKMMSRGLSTTNEHCLHVVISFSTLHTCLLHYHP